MSKEADLATLLEELFSDRESLRRIVYSLPIDNLRLPQMLSEGSTRHVALWLVDELRRRGLVDAEFFRRLMTERPDYLERIQQLEREWVVAEDRSKIFSSAQLELQRPSKAPVVFVSYAHRDGAFFEELSSHLTLLTRKGVINLWHESRIDAGADWAAAIEDQIQEAQIFLLLVSPDFLSSSYIREKELPRVLERDKQGGVWVLPVILRACLWQDSPIAGFQVLPSDGKPIASQADPDRAWVSVAARVRQLALQLLGAK